MYIFYFLAVVVAGFSLVAFSVHIWNKNQTQLAKFTVTIEEVDPKAFIDSAFYSRKVPKRVPDGVKKIPNVEYFLIVAPGFNVGDKFPITFYPAPDEQPTVTPDGQPQFAAPGAPLQFEFEYSGGEFAQYALVRDGASWKLVKKSPSLATLNPYNDVAGLIK
ncbi:hypothetical protein [Terrihabitans soli]|uniref:hypothetical protein n=1 Tax=Terrihabitans soli TaxID=708113 RepID=UPI001CA33C04|nr:hypothetical protein [Terrihabitans soli]